MLISPHEYYERDCEERVMKKGARVIKAVFGVIGATLIMSNMVFVTIFAASPAEETNSAKEQMMDIACHYCGEVITVDISQPHATCSHCGEVNYFSG